MEPDSRDSEPADELGLGELVDAWIAEMLWTSELDLTILPNHQLEIEEKLASSDEALQARGEFEMEIVFKLHAALISDPYYFGDWDEDEVGWPDGPLFRARQEGTTACLAEAGIPVPGSEMLDGELPREGARMIGLTDDELDRLYQRCTDYGLTFPGLSDDERERLLRLQRDYYMDVATRWVADNPEAVVPLP